LLTVIDTGATHESTVLNESDFYIRPHLFFEDLAGYCVGDSAYCITPRLVKPFIDGELEAIDTDNEDEANDRREFKVKLASARVEVEHTFGILKSRFPILSNLASIIGYIDTNERVLHCSRILIDARL